MTEPTAATFRSLDHLSGGVAAHPEEADELREMLQQLESQVAAVRELHQRRQWAETTGTHCAECGFNVDYPCATIRALDGE